MTTPLGSTDDKVCVENVENVGTMDSVTSARHVQIDMKASRKLVRKIDWKLMPVVGDSRHLALAFYPLIDRAY